MLTPGESPHLRHWKRSCGGQFRRAGQPSSRFPGALRARRQPAAGPAAAETAAAAPCQTLSRPRPAPCMPAHLPHALSYWLPAVAAVILGNWTYRQHKYGERQVYLLHTSVYLPVHHGCTRWHEKLKVGLIKLTALYILGKLHTGRIL